MFKGIIRPLEKRDEKAVEKIFDLYWKDDFRNNLKDKLKRYFQNDRSLTEQRFKFIVAEENGEIVGVAAKRKAPEHMKRYASTSNPVEFYVSTAKEQGSGIGSALVSKRLEEAKKEGYTEVVLFSGETHQNSWKFHDKNFERVGPAVAPNGEVGFVWRKVLG